MVVEGASWARELCVRPCSIGAVVASRTHFISVGGTVTEAVIASRTYLAASLICLVLKKHQIYFAGTNHFLYV